MRIMRWLTATALGSIIGLGCATLPYPDRWDFGTFRMIATDAERISAHCHKRIELTKGKHDNGDMVQVGEEVRACTDYKTPEKPTVFISKKWRRCAPHEGGHATFLGPPDLVAAMRPCLGERK